MEPKVSVIIPTYNRSALLLLALQSVFEQTYRDLEIIVVDDGSVDDTRERLKSLSEKKIIKYIYQRNQGLPVARNTGIMNSTGEYISVLDDDDLWYPYTIRRQLEELRGNPEVGMVYSDAMIIDENGKELGLRVNRPLPSGDIYKEVTAGRVQCLMGTIMVRRACIQEVGMFDPALRKYEDIDFVRKIAEKYKIKYIDAPLLRYRKHRQRITDDKYDIQFLIRRFENVFDSEKFKKMDVDFKSDILSKYHLQLGRGYYQLSNCKLARRHLLRAIYYSPKRLKKLRTYKHVLKSIIGKRRVELIKKFLK